MEKKGASYNMYYDKTQELTIQFESNPADKSALIKLEDYSRHSSYWYRSYAYGSLGELALKNVGNCRAELIPYFDNALRDSDYGVRQSGVDAILDIGSPAVEGSLPELIGIAEQGKEDDITWTALEALGELKNQKEAQKLLPLLLKTALKLPPDGTPDEAPQVRYEALDAIGELAENNSLNCISELEDVMNKSNSSYKGRVAKVVLDLDPTNKMALKWGSGSE